MRPILFSFPASVSNGIITSTTTSATGVSLPINGTLRDYTSLNVGVYQAIVGGGIQRVVTITSTGDISTSTFTISGYDLRGAVVATSIAGPNAATATTTQEFAIVTSVSVGTAATTAFTVGVGTSGSTNWVQTDTFKTPFSVSAAVSASGAGIAISVLSTNDDANAAAPTTTFGFATVTATATLTASTTPVRYIGCTFTGISATQNGGVTIQQAG